VTLSEGAEPRTKYVLECSRPDAEHLETQGMFRGDSVSLRMRKLDPSTFVLMNRGFHLNQEAPFTR